MKLLKTVARLSWTEKKLLLESIYFLGRSRLLIKRLGFKKLCERLGSGETLQTTAPADAKSIVIGAMIERVSPHLPWNCLCLTQAIAGYYMLKRRGIHGQVYIGVNKEQDKEELFSHAWLKSGSSCVTGEKGHEQFKVITVLGRSSA